MTKAPSGWWGLERFAYLRSLYAHTLAAPPILVAILIMAAVLVAVRFMAGFMQRPAAGSKVLNRKPLAAHPQKFITPAEAQLGGFDAGQLAQVHLERIAHGFEDGLRVSVPRPFSMPMTMTERPLKRPRPPMMAESSPNRRSPASGRKPSISALM